LRSCQLWSYSRTSQHFTEPEGSLPCFRELSIGRHPEPDQQQNPHHSILSLLDPVNIIHPPVPGLPKWSLYFFWLFHQYPTRIPLLSHSCYMSTHLILLDLIVLIMLGEEYKL
jgi:hypothetical protein